MRTLWTSLTCLALGLTACAAESDTVSETESAEARTVSDGSEDADTGGAPEQLLLDTEIADGADRVVGMAPVGSAAFDPECFIAEDRVAGIALPETLGDFAAAFPEGTALNFYSTYMVDLSALCVRSEGEDALCAITFAEESYTAEAAVESLIVSSPICNDAAGVGPGTPVSTAIEAYGEPTFGFSWDNEGREYVTFANAPSNFLFRARSDTADAETQTGGLTVPGGEHGGDYSGVEGDGTYFETSTAYPDAEIREVWISRPVG
ncbi:hypothetical protein [Parasphingopyxis sp.]|uniref:hypothetical protein n=1 Tax=Parasphingopyxis sp. TaxID=1920299 RepID=UPI002605DC70|nr:hypothetical protein [Parasphingopyxis sp.]